MKKFIYIDDLNRRGETFGYEVGDFISSYNISPGKPVKTGSSGLIDPSLLPLAPSSSLQLVKIANETIVGGDCLKADSDTTVSLANFNLTQEDATVLGIAITSANTGEQVTILVLGIITLPIFSIFSVNSLLFLDELGGITDVRPTSGFLTPIGKSMGNGSIMVQLGTPNKLTP